MLGIFVYLVFLLRLSLAENISDEENSSTRYTIEGRVYALDQFAVPPNWQANTRLHVNGGEFIGFVREDGTFIIHNIPSGSYVLEVLHPQFSYEPVRVEINTKGKYRARKVNYIQTSQVIQVPYPLLMKPLSRTRYFQIREQWRITDFLANPMVLMMVLPLLLIMVLPKMMNDPETKKEMEQIGSLTKFEMPEMSQMMTNLLSGAPQNEKAPSKKSIKQKKKA